MLPDRFFTWPYPGDDLRAGIDEIRPTLAKSGLAMYLGGPEGDLAEYIVLTCRSWNINPWWVLVSMQREQSALTTPSLSRRELDAICGFVGVDEGRAAMPGYYGVYMQVQRICEQSAWLMGYEDSLKWPMYWRTKKSTKRWRIGLPVSVQQPDKQWKDQITASRGEYLQLAYTPHWDTLAKNELLAHTHAPLRYL